MSMLLAFAFRLSIQTFVPSTPIYISLAAPFVPLLPARFAGLFVTSVLADAIGTRFVKPPQSYLTSLLDRRENSVRVITNTEKIISPCRVTIIFGKCVQTRIYENFDDFLSIPTLYRRCVVIEYFLFTTILIQTFYIPCTLQNFKL